MRLVKSLGGRYVHLPQVFSKHLFAAIPRSEILKFATEHGIELPGEFQAKLTELKASGKEAPEKPKAKKARTEQSFCILVV